LDAAGHRKVKGNMDVELAVDAIELAEKIDEMFLFSGDGDLRTLVEAVQRRGVRVTVISTIAIQPPMIADELRRQADVFTDLIELRSRVGRDPSERPATLPRRTTTGARAATRCFADPVEMSWHWQAIKVSVKPTDCQAFATDCCVRVA